MLKGIPQLSVCFPVEGEENDSAGFSIQPVMQRYICIHPGFRGKITLQRRKEIVVAVGWGLL
jgi:hypothetical protein